VQNRDREGAGAFDRQLLITLSSKDVVFHQPEVLKISRCDEKVFEFYSRKTSHSNLLDPYLTDFIVLIMSIRFIRDLWPLWYSYCFYEDHAYCERRH